MTVHNRFHPTINLRTPIIAAGFAAVALASFAAGAITFDGPGRSSGAGDSVAAVSAALPASPGVGTLTRDQVLAADRAAHDAFADAHAASSETVAGARSSAALEPSAGVRDLTWSEQMAADLAIHDAGFPAESALATTMVPDLTEAQMDAFRIQVNDAFAEVYGTPRTTLSPSGGSLTAADALVSGTEFTAAMVAEEHEAYISRIIP